MTAIAAPPPPVEKELDRAVTSRKRQVSGYLLGSAAAAMFTAYLFTQDPNEPGHFPTCPLKATTNIACPGCGGLRATYAAMHGDFIGALKRNPLVFIVIPFLAYLWMVGLGRALGRWNWKMPQLQAWQAVAIGVAIAVLFVVRNISVGPFPWFPA